MTPKEQAFVRGMVKPNPTVIASAVGYAHPSSAATRNMQNPAINAAIVAEAEAALNNELLPLSIEQARKMLGDSATPAGARTTLIRMIWDRTLGSDEDKARKELHEMTLEELERRRQELLSERANAAKVIDGSAQSAPNPPPDAGLFG